MLDFYGNDHTGKDYFSQTRLPQQIQIQVKIQTIAKDRGYIAIKGLETIKEHAYQFINSRVATAFPKNDGKQTPMRGHPVFIAQHATATCCRGCLKKWYQIEKGRALDEKELDYVVALIMEWIKGQLDEKGGSFPT